MGYRIRYLKRNYRKTWLTFGFFILFLICAWYFAGDKLTQLVFPDQLEDLISALQQGSDLSEAVSAFCQGILNGS